MVGRLAPASVVERVAPGESQGIIDITKLYNKEKSLMAALSCRERVLLPAAWGGPRVSFTFEPPPTPKHRPLRLARCDRFRPYHAAVNGWRRLEHSPTTATIAGCYAPP